jgi:phytoene synthase
VWAAQVLYSKILNVIERNGYDVFNKRAYVPTVEKLMCLPGTLVRSRML